jgi:hypothetical protein
MHANLHYRMQNQLTLFASFSGKRRILLVRLTDYFWGQAPKPPWFRFAEGFRHKFPSKQNYAFCFFFRKKKINFRLTGCFWAQAPNPRGSASQKAWAQIFCEAELRFLLLFLEKEGYCQRR